ncbi:CRISPR-associated endonuclease Cas1 [Caminibacter sp.]
MRGLLFVATPGSVVSRKDNNVVITNENGTHKIPIGAIEHIFLFGGVHITTPAIRFATTKGKFIFMLNQFGKTVSVSMPEPITSDYRIRLSQYELLNNKSKKLNIIKMLLKIKAKNVGYILGLNESKYNRSLYIKSLINNIKFDTLQEALGIDGNLNSAMFDFFRDNMLPKGFDFEVRQYHPPKDPVNTLLSLTYSVYYSILIPMAISEGFDPYLGFFHIKRGRHAAFCSDVIEVSRPWLTFFAFQLLQDGFFHPMDFSVNDNGCFMKKKALRAYIKIFSERIIHKEDSFLDYSFQFLRKLKEIISK